MRKDRFSDEALRNAMALAELKYSENPEDQVAFEEAYDFARCQRPDGSFYGTSGQCRKGKESGAKEAAPKKMKTDFRNDVAASAAKRKARDEKIVARQNRDRELLTDIRGKVAEQRALKKDVATLERGAKEAARKVKKDPSKENKDQLKRINAALRVQDRALAKMEREIDKMARERGRIAQQAERERMTPAQRAEAARIRKIIKERG